MGGYGLREAWVMASLTVLLDETTLIYSFQVNVAGTGLAEVSLPQLSQAISLFGNEVHYSDVHDPEP
jgi:hypothetical protein